ncbi:MAG: SDR family NAD(P)-dependent oxidoreductase, partial [Nitrospinota bacterium]|nr:SDR family NAD(P)-dependent oxidoreductase [Nitrospinota bacterium]
MNLSYFDLSGRAALVTGAGRGIGRTLAVGLASAGADVAIADIDLTLAGEAKREIESMGRKCLLVEADVTDPGGIERLVSEAAGNLGGLHILVNNAGVFLDRGRSGIELDITTFRQTMEVNLYGPFLLCQRFLPLIRKNGFGRVVNVSSATSALEGFMGDNRMRGKNAAYRTSKTCLNALTRILADETKGENILVNAASPGRVRTAMTNFEGEKSIEEGADTV